MIKVLFICHGNICRSPMAEFVFKDMLAKKGISDLFYVASGATSTEEIGSDIHRGTKNKLMKEKIPFQQRCAVQIKKSDYDRYNYIIAMDKHNVRNVMHITGGDPDSKIKLLLSFTGGQADIADPWYTGDFDRTYADICRGCRALLTHLEERR